MPNPTMPTPDAQPNTVQLDHTLDLGLVKVLENMQSINNQVIASMFGVLSAKIDTMHAEMGTLSANVDKLGRSEELNERHIRQVACNGFL